jgi:hypothetical protein
VSFIRRIPPPEPEREPIEVVLEELRDLHEIAQLLSLRLARLEAQQHGDRPQTRPETLE